MKLNDQLRKSSPRSNLAAEWRSASSVKMGLNRNGQIFTEPLVLKDIFLIGAQASSKTL